MKEWLFGWVQDIACYTLLMMVVLHVLPSQDQKKYLEFFMGMVFILVVASPFLKLLGMEGRLEELYVHQSFDKELEEFYEKQEKLEKKYGEWAENQVKELQEEQEETKKEEEVEMDEQKPVRIEIHVERKMEGD